MGLTLIHLQAGGAEGLPRPVGGDAGVGAGVLGAHVHEDEAVLPARARDLVALGVGLDPHHVLHGLLLQPGHHGNGGAWRRSASEALGRCFVGKLPHLLYVLALNVQTYCMLYVLAFKNST